jgi:hypothetical protein
LETQFEDPTAKGVNFDEIKLGELHEKQAVATWNLLNISAFVRKLSETKKLIKIF